jgi:hypothetical protein
MDLVERRAASGRGVRIIEFVSDVVPEALADALEVVRSRHALCTSVIDDHAGQAWFKLAPELALPFEAIREDPLLTAERLLNSPRWPRGSPLLAATVATPPGGSASSLVLLWHHAIADGRSITQFCSDVVACYEAILRGAVDSLPQYGSFPPPLEHALFGPQQERLDPATVRAFLLSETRALGDLATRASTPTCHPAPTLSRIAHRVVDPPFLQALHEMSTRRRAGLHGVLTASILKAKRGTGDRDAPSMVTTVDLRQARELTPWRNTVALYTSGVRLRYGTLDQDGDVFSAARNARRTLERVRERARLGVLFQELAMEMFLDAGQGPADVVLSNLGLVPEPPASVASIHGGVAMSGFPGTTFHHVAGVRHGLAWNAVAAVSNRDRDDEPSNSVEGALDVLRDACSGRRAGAKTGAAIHV